ncbi:type VI secretion system Vgr family protein [Pseudomonas sp. v388]|uniref:type VI secretion system Vgr family protein n=1 Tax=Pseudomonas sp. v388 TaxID=2479849 RepID=UPI0013156FB5|nr:type VI secretion system tip protein TssI/VgrG [Pseudomonas sp. v388]
MPVTLAIADCRTDLKVISFKGQDGLNEVYGYDIDLISTDPHLKIAQWSGCNAFLCFGAPDHGVHGRVCAASQRYAGTCLSHYRLSLRPALHLLAQRRRRQVHRNLSVPALIARLLEEHGIETCDYRFDHLVGLYPPQPARVQYDETDLHFLQRLCEEEGIHFRFEHSRSRHVLVFADDPASFPEHLPALHFDPESGSGDGTPTLRHLAQVWSLPEARGDRPMHIAHAESAPRPRFRDEHQGRAINQPFDEPAQAQSGLQRQRSIRDLERLRSERRRVQGRSNRSDLHSGRIVLVLDHPDAVLNDQWLVTGVRHAARQLQVLEGFDPHDIAAIVASDLVDAPRQGQPTLAHGYRNDFDALPWATAFRPPLKRHRPRVRGEHSATVVAGGVDPQGRVLIRYDWEPAHPPRTGLHAHVLRGNQPGLDPLLPGARVLVAHFDGDPDRPVICGLLSGPAHGGGLQLHLDGLPVDTTPPSLELGAGQRLAVQTRQALTLHGEQAILELNEQWIAIRGPRTVHASPLTDSVDGQATGEDLQLTAKPGLQGLPLEHCVWYIVRMAQPGLEHLPRLNPDHILYEGVTDKDGYLGLTRQQLRQLAKLYNLTPHTLCLVYPGHCLTLHAWFQQNWTEQQRRAFRVSGL